MREILNIALNDLRNSFAQRGVWINLVAVPIVMTIVIGLVNGGSGSRTYVVDLLSDPASGAYATRFVELLQQEGGAGFVICDVRQAASQAEDCGLKDVSTDTDLRALVEQRVKDSNSIGAVMLPANFTDDLLANKSVKLELLGKGGLNAPQIVRQKVDAVLTRMNGAILAARVAVEQAKPDAVTRTDFYDKVYAAAEAIWASDPVKIEEQTNAQVTAGATSGSNGFGQSAPGMGGMFVLMNALGLATLFIEERQTGTLQRLLILPIPKWTLLAGKLLARYVMCLIVFVILIGVGTAFGVRWGDWPGVIATVLVLVLAATAISLAFSTMVRTQGQAAGIALLLSLTLAPLGGAWWPLSIVPEWMRTVGHISPIAWSQDAFQQLLYYHGTLSTILPQLGVLLLFAVVFFAIGLMRFRYE